MSKKVLLIAPLSEQYSGIRNYGDPSLGVYRISSFLRSHGHYVKVYDSNIHGSIDNFLTEHWDIIGISILNDTLILSLEMFLKLQKQCPESILVCGGAEPILNAQAILDNTNVNIIIIGEGEQPLLDLCNEKPLHEINGIIFRKRAIPITDNLLWEYYKNIDFSEMGYPEYWQLDKDKGRNKTLRLVTSSHCLRGCDFCSLTRIHKSACGHTVKPAFLSGEQIQILIDRALQQIENLQFVYFCEDSILPKISRLDDFCWALSKYKGRLKFLVQTETDKISNKDTIRKFAEAGIIHVTFGLESASENVRIFIKKKQNSEKIENIINWCAEFNITCYYLIILFYPSSTVEDMIINYKTLSRWINDGRVVISIEPYAIPYKGADLYDRDFEFDYKFHTLSNGNVIKHPYIAYPKDPIVKEIMLEFKDKTQSYLDEFDKKEGYVFHSKDRTGKIFVNLLGDILKSRNFI